MGINSRRISVIFEKSSFSEAIHYRGIDLLIRVFKGLKLQAADLLPNAHLELGSLVGIDDPAPAQILDAKTIPMIF